jgi:hypothetical protein
MQLYTIFIMVALCILWDMIAHRDLLTPLILSWATRELRRLI